MKTKFLLSLSALLLTGTLFAQTSGGPDTYGYTWKNSSDPSGPAYNWKEIKGIGTQITGFGDDNQKGPFNTNFMFKYYWADYNKVWIGSNGWIGFQNIGNIAAPFPAIPLPSAPNNYIAPMASDLTFTQTNSSAVAGATAWYWTNSLDTLIVQYDSVPYWVTGTVGYSGRYTFQAILSAKDSSITYQYKVAQAGTIAYSATEGVITGIENSTGQIGLQVSSGVFPAAGTAVKFYYPTTVTYQVKDATPAWNQNAENGGFFATPGVSKSLNANIFNAGNQPLTNITAKGEIYDVSLTKLYDTSVVVASLAAGADVTINYPKNYIPTNAGTYIFRSTTTVTGDINPANNVTEVEMVVVDTTGANIVLSYTGSTPGTTGSGWGGNGGQGIYVEPPYYPAHITSLDFMVGNSGTTGYHLVKIFDDDGAANSPGTVLFSDSVAAATPTGSYTNVALPTPLTISTGGFYVGWYENDDTLSVIATDQALPLSNRNFEIIGGNWATYRNNLSEDLMINVNIEQSLGVSNFINNRFMLGQNYPNPANNSTMVNYTVQKSGNARFSVQSLLGTQVETLDLGNVAVGEHSLTVNTASYAPGVYFYTLSIDGVSSTRKMVVSK